MKAMLYHESGPADVLTYVDVPDPRPGPADVVVDVGAVALNRLDVVQRNGWFHLPGFTFPHIAGMDVAGTVSEIGDRVDNMSVGDRVVIDPSLAGVVGDSKLAGMGDLHGELGVIGGTVAGGYAEKCLAPASHVYAIPEAISFEHAACFPTAYLTAGHALFAVGGLRSGETIVIHAAGSGLSSAGIQLAKHAGAVVLATARSHEKCERARTLGADHVFNTTEGDLAVWVREVTGGKGADVVFDHVGSALFAPSLFALGIRGRLVCCGNTSGDEAMIPSLGHLFHSGIRIMGSDPYEPDEFAPLWESYCTGDFETVIDSVFPLRAAVEAQEKMLAGDFFGKIVLTP